MATSGTGGLQTLECSICLLHYNLSDKIPQGLRCMHTFCKSCMTTMTKSDTINCPKCRRVTNAKDIATNYSLMEILEELCEECFMTEKVNRCEHCGRVLCQLCTNKHAKMFNVDIQKELKTLHGQVKSAIDLSMDRSVLEHEEAKAETAVKDIQKAIKYHQEAIKTLENKLLDEVLKIKTNNIEHHLHWSDKLDSKISETKQFVNKVQQRLSASHKISLAATDMDHIHQELEAMSDSLSEMMQSKPVMKEYCFKRSIHIQESYVGDIVGCLSSTNKNTESPKRYVESYTAATFKCMTGQHGNGPEDFDNPAFVACVRDNIWVSDNKNNRIKVYDKALNLTKSFGQFGNQPTDFVDPFGLAVGLNDEVYICDADAHRIKVYTSDGKFIYEFGTHGSGANHLNGPNDIAVSQDGEVFICDSYNYRIQVVQPKETYIRTIGGKGQGPGLFEFYPVFVTVTKNKRVIVKEQSKMKVHMFRSSGEYMGQVPATLPLTIGASFLNKATEDKDNNLLITDYFGHILVLNSRGEYVCTIGSPGDEPGQLCEPKGVCVDEEGNIFVCDSGNNRLQMFGI